MRAGWGGEEGETSSRVKIIGDERRQRALHDEEKRLTMIRNKESDQQATSDWWLDERVALQRSQITFNSWRWNTGVCKRLSKQRGSRTTTVTSPHQLSHFHSRPCMFRSFFFFSSSLPIDAMHSTFLLDGYWHSFLRGDRCTDDCWCHTARDNKKKKKIHKCWVNQLWLGRLHISTWVTRKETERLKMKK